MSDSPFPDSTALSRPARRVLSRRTALVRLLGGTLALGLAACTPTPPRTESPTAAPATKPTEAEARHARARHQQGQAGPGRVVEERRAERGRVQAALGREVPQRP